VEKEEEQEGEQTYGCRVGRRRRKREEGEGRRGRGRRRREEGGGNREEIGGRTRERGERPRGGTREGARYLFLYSKIFTRVWATRSL
jgi:hypothetical protein